MTIKSKDCACKDCREACTYKPGWFVPGQVEKVAEYLYVPLATLFKKKLMVDWWVDTPNNVFVLSPAIVGGAPGHEFPGNPRGKCVFYKKGRCEIHAVKPRECREAHHERAPDDLHKQMADKWRSKRAQAQIRKLLGREPGAAEASLFDSLMWPFGGGW